MAEDLQVALGGIEQAQQQFNGSGLAGTIGSQQPEHLATPDLEIDVIDGPRLGPAPEVFEDFGQAAHGDDHLLFRFNIPDYRFSIARRLHKKL